jgi:glycosyltransferase 2 family protein
MSTKNILRGIISLAILIALMLQLDLKILLQKTLQLDIWLFLLSIGMMIIQIFFLSLRWQECLNVGGRNQISFKHSLFMNIAGCFANMFFIASIGGIVAKSILAMRQGITLIHTIFATIFDRFLTLFTLVIFSTLSSPFLLRIIDEKLIALLTAIIGIFLFSILLIIGIVKSGIARTYILSSRKRSRVYLKAQQFLKNKPMILRTLFQSIMAQTAFFGGVYILALGIDPQNAKNIIFFALLPILALIASLPISYGGWGVREGAFVFGLSLIGFKMEDAFMLSMQVGLASIVAPFIIGLPFLVRDDLKDFLIRPKHDHEKNNQ